MPNRALLIIDTQVDFTPGGSLAVEGGDEVAKFITLYIFHKGAMYDELIATQDWHVNPRDHFASYSRSEPDYKDTWPHHCIAWSVGAEFHPNLELPSRTVIFRKGKYAAAYSGFEGEQVGDRKYSLEKYLKTKDIKQVDIVGIATDYCVKATALDAAKLGFKPTVILNLTAAVAEETKESAIAEMTEAGVNFVDVNLEDIGAN